MQTTIQSEIRNCSMTEYFLTTNKPTPVIVICPGGAYQWRSDRESAPVANAFNKKGYHAVVLNYNLEAEELLDGPLMDLSWAVSHLRSHAKEYQIDPKKILVCGFSAGGHLAASLGVFWSDQSRFPSEEIRSLHKPNGLILCYPVISAFEHAHVGSFLRLSKDKKIRESYSLETKVSSDVPPCFIWHTMTDDSVSFYNSLLFAEALKKHDVSCELMIFPKGSHGLSLATKEVEDESHKRIADAHVARWFDQCIDWISYSL